MARAILAATVAPRGKFSRKPANFAMFQSSRLDAGMEIPGLARSVRWSCDSLALTYRWSIRARSREAARPDALAAMQGSINMTIGIAHLQPIVSLIAGVLILVMPRLLNYIVAIYLIVSGAIGLGLLR
jgi:hypothetical protein